MSIYGRPSEMLGSSALDDIGGVKYSVKDIEKERELERKKQKMIEEFKAIDRSSDDYISLSEWLDYLQNKVGGFVDIEEAKSRFNDYDMDKDNMITLNEFITCYLQDEDYCKQQIQNSRKIIEEAKKQKASFEDKLREAKDTEMLNNEGVMTGSILVVQIMEVRDLTRTGTVFVELLFDNQRQITNPRSSGSAVWNDKFSFDVTSKEQKIVINLCGTNDRRPLGTYTYELRSLNPPDYTVDTWVPLQYQNQKMIGNLRLSLQWIVSRVEFFNNIIDKIDKEIIESENELNFFETKLNILQEPFGALRAKRGSYEASPKVAERGIKTQPTTSTTTNIQLPDQLVAMENRAKENIDRVFPQVANKLGLDKYPVPVLSKYGALIYLGLSCLMLFARPDFFNTVLAALCFYAVGVDRGQLKDKWHYIMGLIIVAFVYDLLWLGFSGSDYFGDIRADGGNENVLRYISMFAALLCLIYKPIFLILVWKDLIDQEKAAG